MRFPLTILLLATTILHARTQARREPVQTPFSVVEATIPDMQKAMQDRRVTSRDLAIQYLTRIAMYENKLHAAITVNPNAIKEAEERDRERSRGKVRGPLHGIPIALKDIIHTTDMPTTGGAMAFEGFVPPYEATITKNLREAGAIIIAKTSLTELANWVAGPPTPMPTNYNAITGFGMNPYDPRRDPREGFSDGRPAMSPGGSSSGIGTAANFWAANVGTETSGSILTPANSTMLVGIKPTVGRVSRYGVIPITADQDTAGPMAKSVTDAAILLGALESPSPDPNDAATNRCTPPPGRDYTRFLRREGLKGARIGIPRASFYDRNADQSRLMNEAIAVLKSQGATIVDPANIPSAVDAGATRNILVWNICSGAGNGKGRDANCSSVLKYGMKRDFNRWLATLGPSAPVKTLTELREWNLKHERAGAVKFGQSNLDISDEVDLIADKAKYEADRAKDLNLAGVNGIDAAMKTHALDALLFPAASGSALAAKPGYPTIIVPFGTVSMGGGFPAGFTPQPAPFGVSFTGMACSEPRLIELGYAFEQATRRRIPPAL
jgi:amidase